MKKNFIAASENYEMATLYKSIKNDYSLLLHK